MFSVGDKVVHPMHGAGVIEAIEEKDMFGESKLFYIMKIPVGNLTETISVNKAEEIGVRPVFPGNEVEEIIATAMPIEMSDNWNVRKNDNMAIIKSGKLKNVVEVFKTLIFRERKKTLSTAEKKILGTTKQIILSEIIVSLDIDKQSAEQMLERSVMPV